MRRRGPGTHRIPREAPTVAVARATCEVREEMDYFIASPHNDVIAAALSWPVYKAGHVPGFAPLLGFRLRYLAVRHRLGSGLVGPGDTHLIVPMVLCCSLGQCRERRLSVGPIGGALARLGHPVEFSPRYRSSTIFNGWTELGQLGVRAQY